MTKNFVVFESNNGGLSLFVLDESNAPIYGHSGYEYNPENLMEDIKSLYEMESLMDLDSWEGNGVYTGLDFTPWEELGGIETAYNLMESDPSFIKIDGIDFMKTETWVKSCALSMITLKYAALIIWHDNGIKGQNGYSEEEISKVSEIDDILAEYENAGITVSDSYIDFFCYL